MTITKRQLTGGEKAGSGLYDELMRTSQSHLEAEFKAGRIKGTDYANAYLGMMQANLSTGLQFVMQKELTNAQVEIAKEQIKQNEKQNELLELQKAQLEIANQTAQYNLDVTLPAQTAILEEQLLQAKEQTKLLTSQIAQVNAQTALASAQETLVEEQTITERTKTTNPTGGSTKASFDKTLAEIEVLNQKKITEQKQTTGSIADTQGLIGYEMTLKNLQGESFLRDAEQKATKIYSDIFSVMYSTEAEGMDNNAWGFSSANSDRVLEELLKGVGANV
ncbi:virion structural protein [Vibrio phage D292]